MLRTILDLLDGFIDALLDLVLMALPISPFTQHIDNLANMPYLGYLNWFVPIGTFVAIGASWLTAIAIFYLYKIILRWVKAIG